MSFRWSVSKDKIRSIEARVPAGVAEFQKQDSLRKARQPLRKLLFRPKVYASWREEDLENEIEAREKLLAEIAEKEYRLMQTKKNKGDFIEEESSDSDDHTAMATIKRLKSRQQREEEYKSRIENEQKREKAEKDRELEAKMQSEITNPSKYGWIYTDGYYEDCYFFGVKESIVDILNDQQDEWRDQWRQRYHETFTQKFRRHFWPPKLFFRDKVFRTRGTYMDFPEVIADMPKPVNVEFEREPHDILSNTLDIFKDYGQRDDDGDTLNLGDKGSKNKQFEGKKKKKLNAMDGDVKNGQEDYYYDDTLGEFFPKKLGFHIEYYHDGFCWRSKRLPNKKENRCCPYDYYFDDESRRFYARIDYKGKDEFVYDERDGVYRIDFVPESLTPQAMAEKKRKKEPNKKKGKLTGNLDDFFFNELQGQWEVKVEAPRDVYAEINWDENGQRFCYKYEGDWRGLTGLSPDDFFFDEKSGKFYQKPARQAQNFKYYPADGVWKLVGAEKVSTHRTRPQDYYFDQFEGQFKLKKKGRAEQQYYLQKFANIYRLHPPPKSGLYPEDYYWDTNKKQWLLRAIRLGMLKPANLGKLPWVADKSQIQKKDKEGNYMKPEDFYWDIEEGLYIPKTANDTYFIDTDGVCKSEKLKKKKRNRKYPHDYYVNEKKNDFVLKDKTLPEDTYTFDMHNMAWRLTNGFDESETEKTKVRDGHYFDMESESWKKSLLKHSIDPLCKYGIKRGGDKNVMIPDDYWFDESEGRFQLKVQEDADNYYFLPLEGIWKKTGVKKVSSLNSRNFYFDDFTSRFKLKVAGHDKDYVYDKANKIYRHVIALGKSRSGYQPTDFDWHPDLKTYTLVPKATLSKVYAPPKEEVGPADPIRTYTQSWLPRGVKKPTPPPPESETDVDPDLEKKIKVFPKPFEKKTPHEYKEIIKSINYPPVKSRIPEKVMKKIEPGDPNGFFVIVYDFPTDLKAKEVKALFDNPKTVELYPKSNVAVVYFETEEDVTKNVEAKNNTEVEGHRIVVRSGLHKDNL